DDRPLRGWLEFQTHGFIANAAIASGERQRVADVFGGGRDIVQQSRFARIGLLSEVQPEFVVAKRIRRVLKQLALRDGGNAALVVLDIAFRDASALQQRGYRRIVLAKDRDRLASGEPRRAW